MSGGRDGKLKRSSIFNLPRTSPLQYQKQLGLQEARRLMLTEMLDAALAAHQVGYEGPSQFCREYGRLFGAPPRRDIARLRLDARASARTHERAGHWRNRESCSFRQHLGGPARMLNPDINPVRH